MNNYTSLQDQLFIHELYSSIQSERKVARIMGVSKTTVHNILQKDINSIIEAINLADTQTIDSGCYITRSTSSDWFPHSYQQALSPLDDPTFEAVAAWEELEQGYGLD